MNLGTIVKNVEEQLSVVDRAMNVVVLRDFVKYSDVNALLEIVVGHLQIDYDCNWIYTISAGYVSKPVKRNLNGFIDGSEGKYIRSLR